MMKRIGFTLIELLVVIAIIALLVSILMPSLQKAKDLAKDVVCRSNEKTVSYGVVLYAEENDDIYPYNSSPTPPNSQYYPDLSWACKIGKVPDTTEDLGWDFGEDTGAEADTGIIDGYKICVEQGYVDFQRGSVTEGPFKCPAFIDQVNPKAAWLGAVSSQYSINRSLSASVHEPTATVVRVTKSSDLRGMSVLLGDGNLNPGNGIRVVHAFDTRGPNGSLAELAPEKDTGYYSFGPWPFQQYVQKWQLKQPYDFYGHPGERANIAYTDAHVAPVDSSSLRPEDWRID